MGTIILFTAVTALLAGLITFGFTISKGTKAVWVGLAATVLAGISEFILLYAVMPSFAHWTSGGYVMSGVIVLTCSLLGSYLGHYESYRASYTGANILLLVCVILVAVFLLGSCSAHPPAAMDNAFWDNVAAMANIREATAAELQETTTDGELLKITPKSAELDAKGEMPGDVGSFASVGISFEQTVNNDQVYITDLRVSNWRGFRSNGYALPGYFVRPARAISSPTTFVPGFSMKYVPDAKWNTDLRRHVYLNYELGCACVIDNLDVLEIDDTGNPFYTGTIWKYTVGAVGLQPVGVIVVDPITGLITPYTLETTPVWVDRIYSLERMSELVGWWATYSQWDAEWVVQDTSGKMKVDAAEDVYGAHGRLEYMITVTSIGSDQTLKFDLRANPRTGEIVKFPASGKTLSAVDDVIDEQTFTEEINTALGAEPVECERQPLLGRMTYYCILQSRGEGEGSAGAIVGYSFLQERFTTSPNMVVVASNFKDAWNELRLQITRGVGETEIQGEGAQMLVARGKVLVKADTATEGMIWFLVATKERPEGLYFRVSVDDPIIALTHVGDEVEVTAYDLQTDQVNDVISIVNFALPPVTTTP